MEISGELLKKSIEKFREGSFSGGIIEEIFWRNFRMLTRGIPSEITCETLGEITEDARKNPPKCPPETSWRIFCDFYELFHEEIFEEILEGITGTPGDVVEYISFSLAK